MKQEPIFFVWETNAKLLPIFLRGEYASWDLAESYCVKFFRDSKQQQDLMILDKDGNQVAQALSIESFHIVNR